MSEVCVFICKVKLYYIHSRKTYKLKTYHQTPTPQIWNKHGTKDTQSIFNKKMEVKLQNHTKRPALLVTKIQLEKLRRHIFTNHIWLERVSRYII